jgi:hypothetical protein
MSTVFSTNGQRQVGAGEKREREGKRKQKNYYFFNKYCHIIIIIIINGECPLFC